MSEAQDITITVKNVGVRFQRRAESLFSRRSNLRSTHNIWALKNINFTARSGEHIGFIGCNGAGKTTLSRVCGGILMPDEGTLTVKGRATLLNVSAGLIPNLTGEENIRLKCAFQGLSPTETNQLTDEIIEFSELGKFIAEPVRTYSSGMQARLGFAIATSSPSELLILDEVLATGDALFYQKANKRLEEIRGKARNVILVSHDMNAIRTMCNRAIWLDKGEIQADGAPDEAIEAYAKATGLAL